MQAVNPEGLPVSLNRTIEDVTLFLQNPSADDISSDSCSYNARTLPKGGVLFLIDRQSYGCEDESCFFEDGSYYVETTDEFDAADYSQSSRSFLSAKSSELSQLSLEESVAIAKLRGCAAIVSDKPLSDPDIPVFVVSNVAEAFGFYCHALYGNPAKSLKIVGITGTSGKTSSSYLIAGMLAESGHQVGLIGTLGIYDGEMMHASRATTPPAEELAYWLRKMVENGCSHAILEISSESIVQNRLAGIELDAVCLTNIRRDHLEFHRSVENYRRSKMSVFRYAKKEGIAICNADDRLSNAILPLIDYPVLTTGIRELCEVSATILENNRGEQTFLVNAGSEVVSVRTRMIGKEHVYNSLTAFALAMGWGIDLKTTARGIERVECVPGRLERIDCGQPFGVFIDCARTQDSLGAALRTLKNITAGRVFCILGTDPAQEQEMRPLLGRAMELYSDIPVLTRSEPNNGESVADAMEAIIAGFTQGDKARIILNRADAIAWVLSNAEPDDTVLIVGPGISNHPGKSKKPFCDRVFTKSWLYENQPCILGKR